MKVELISYTPDALELLLFTKNTRLQGVEDMEGLKALPMEEKLEHLAYMRDTIKSSWEFVNYVFKISGVTRAFTHQLVRTRTASYAQEAMRVVDASKADWLTPPGANEEQMESFDLSMEQSISDYSQLVEMGMPRQDARGVIPTNIQTSVMMNANLRTLHQMAELRLCKRTQGEYQDVFKAMKAAVVAVHPWAEEFIEVFCANHGTCAFPRYEECPVRPFIMKPSDQKIYKDSAKVAWSKFEHEANVELVAPGRTM